MYSCLGMRRRAASSSSCGGGAGGGGVGLRGAAWGQRLVFGDARPDQGRRDFIMLYARGRDGGPRNQPRRAQCQPSLSFCSAAAGPAPHSVRPRSAIPAPDPDLGAVGGANEQHAAVGPGGVDALHLDEDLRLEAPHGLVLALGWGLGWGGWLGEREFRADQAASHMVRQISQEAGSPVKPPGRWCSAATCRARLQMGSMCTACAGQHIRICRRPLPPLTIRLPSRQQRVYLVNEDDRGGDMGGHRKQRTHLATGAREGRAAQWSSEDTAVYAP